ncbi:hypothetical protein GCM10010393_51550 [Streptomyces gobitricini]|uniref:Uncharacterized protein n=1 Tax=Streptomyces gobitricini TaxID=68211 RepID=A0ABN3N0T2_9ACTN
MPWRTTSGWFATVSRGRWTGPPGPRTADGRHVGLVGEFHGDFVKVSCRSDYRDDMPKRFSEAMEMRYYGGS